MDRAERIEPRWTERFPVARLPIIGDVAVAAAASGVAYIARLAADPFLPPGFPFLTFFPAVILTSFLLGSRAGALTAVFAGLLAWYKFIPPAGFQLERGSAMAMALYMFITATEVALVHWMQRSNQLLLAEREENARLAETRALLFRELQHRVSNNLQVAAALLTMQRKRIANAEASAALDEACRRLGLIGRISRKLYGIGGGGQPLGPLLEQIGQDIIEASGGRGVTLRIEDAAEVRVRPAAAVPVALVVAEAIANAIEHGFGREQERPLITVRVERASGLLLEVQDNGRGLPDGFRMKASDSLGLQIATMLAKQLGGQFRLMSGEKGGTIAQLELPEECVE